MIKTLDEKLRKKAERHLEKVDPVMEVLIERFGPCRLTTCQAKPLQSLLRAIIGQQLSAKAANTISSRFFHQLGKDDLKWPELLLSIPDISIRNCGISFSKITFLKEVARAVVDGSLNFDEFKKMNDEEVISCIKSIKGVGNWTAEMFLVFGLQRPDVFSTTDAGLSRAIKNLYARPNCHKADKINRIPDMWKPYRTIASWYLWRTLD